MAAHFWQRASEMVSTSAGAIGVGTAAVVGVATAAYLFSKPPPVTADDFDFENQSVRLEDGVYANRWTVENGKLLEYTFEDGRTVYEAFLRGRTISGDNRCLGSRTGPNREYEWISYNQVFERMQAFGSGLLSLGVEPGQKTNMGIFAQNRAEWVIADMTCQMFSIVTVALYDTLGSDACVYIVHLCDLSAVICDTVERAEILMKRRKDMPTLVTVVMIENVDEAFRKKAEAVGIKVLTFAEVENLGRKNLRKPVPPKPSDLSTICFTSGTTGDPKGVMITHAMLIADIAAVMLVAEKTSITDPNDVHLSYLPLAHMYERVVVVKSMLYGCGIGFYSRDILLLFDDLQALKPTIFPTVPRLLNKIRDKVLAGVATSKIKSALFHLALSRKMKEIKRGVFRKDSIWDKLVFHKIQALLGGNVTTMSTGSAPLSEETFDFIRCVFGSYLLEGYGQTETTAALSATYPGDPETGHVGGPLACNYVKLIDIPEMEYKAKDGIGEICVKGNNVTSGYYRNPEKTMEAFTPDGWLRTGDVGCFKKNGALKIVDRCKHIFKLQQGEYIAPEKIEVVYSRSKYVQQCFVDGNSTRFRCMAIVVPDPDFLFPWAANNGLPKDMKVLCNNEAVRKVVLEDILQTGKLGELRGFEQVLDIFLEPEPFSMDKDLLTPTFKNKRPQLRKYFASKIALLYSRNEGKA